MKDVLMNYTPYNEQEQHDLNILIDVLQQKDVFTRDNLIGHFTASAWVVNEEMNKVLMCYHKIYDSWAWLGGHSDGMKDLKAVALKEVKEESGLKELKLVDERPFSIEILTVDGHIKNGHYVSSHLHYNVTYLIQANEQDILKINEKENTGLQWFLLDDALKASSEPWFVENIYKKLNQKLREHYVSTSKD